MGGIAVCMCMACGGSDTKDYWGDTSNGGKEEPYKAVLRLLKCSFLQRWR